MLERYDKIITTSIIAAVAIILITSVLIPVIDDASQGTETETEAEGSFGLPISYHNNPEFRNRASIISIKVNSLGILQIYNTLESAPVYMYDGPRADFPDKMIVYADNNATVYIDGDYIYFSNVTDPIPLTTSTLVSYRDGSYRYGTADGFVTATTLTYYYSIDTEGDYSNFNGSNPPTMDTPAASANGMYIGEKYITETVVPPYAAVLNVIPILMIVGVIVTVIGVVLYQKRDV